MKGKKIFVYDSAMDEFSYPPSMPFNTSRTGLVKEMIESLGLLAGSDREQVEPRKLQRHELEKFHTPAYIDALIRAGQGHSDEDMIYMGMGPGDCPVFEGVYEYCRFAAGATVVAAEQIIADKASIAFNPSGGFHHAHADRASGFCYLNDVVLGIIKLTDANKRVAFLDVDVHHTDGVQEAFYDRNDVMTISLHQTGRTLFPGTGFEDEIGNGRGKGFSVNMPMPPGTYDQAFIKAVDQVAIPLIKAFHPDVIVIELGTDALAGDPLAMLNLTNNVYADIIAELLNFDKPILATGGGGYNVKNTVRAWTLCWAAMCGDDQPNKELPPVGGVMLESNEWAGGLRDRVLVQDDSQKEAVDEIVDAVIETVKNNVFAIHGI